MSSEVECLNKANASKQVVAIDGIIDNLAKNWHPTGFYNVNDVQHVLDAFANQGADVGVALRDAPISTSDATQVRDQAFADLMRKYKDPSSAYVDAIAKARAGGVDVIDAPGFKDWVLRSMRAISDGYVTATVLHCRQTWVEKWLDKAYSGLHAIGEVVWKMSSVAANIVISAVKAVETSFGILAKIIRWSPWIAVGLAGTLAAVWAYRKYHGGAFSLPGSSDDAINGIAGPHYTADTITDRQIRIMVGDSSAPVRQYAHDALHHPKATVRRFSRDRLAEILNTRVSRP